MFKKAPDWLLVTTACGTGFTSNMVAYETVKDWARVAYIFDLPFRWVSASYIGSLEYNHCSHWDDPVTFRIYLKARLEDVGALQWFANKLRQDTNCAILLADVLPQDVTG